MERIEDGPPRHRVAIQAGCPRCGRVDVPLRNLHVWVDRAGLGSYSFICSGCRELVRNPADAGTMDALLTAAPPLGAEDLHGFRKELERDDWFSRLTDFHRSTTGEDHEEPRQGVRRAIVEAMSALINGPGTRHRMMSS